MEQLGRVEVIHPASGAWLAEDDASVPSDTAVNKNKRARQRTPQAHAQTRTDTHRGAQTRTDTPRQRHRQATQRRKHTPALTATHDALTGQGFPDSKSDGVQLEFAVVELISVDMI